MLTGTADSARSAPRPPCARSTCSARGRRCCALAGVDSIGEPARDRRCCSPSSTVAGLVAGPVQDLVSRRIEARADAHALALTGDPADFRVDAGAGSATVNLADLDPPRWEYLLFATPSVHRGADGRRPRVRAGGRPMSRTLLVTNDFPPRPGGIQAFVHNLAVRQPAGSRGRLRLDAGAGRAKFDAAQPFPVVRQPTRLLLPTPAGRAGGPPSWPARTAATRCGSARPRRSGCSPPGCARRAGIAPGGRAPPTATRSAGRRCPAPGRLLRRIGRRRRRRHLPRRVHPQPAGPGARRA